MTIQIGDVSDVRASLALRDLLGGSVTARTLRPGEHPLASGFQALRAFMTPGVFTQAQHEELTLLNRTAGALMRFREDWKDEEDKLRAAMLRSETCRELMFELDLATSGLGGFASQLRWTGLGEGEPDFRTQDPSSAIECKHIYGVWSADKIRTSVHKASNQHANETVPLIVVLGFEVHVPAETVRELVFNDHDVGRLSEEHSRISSLIVSVRLPSVHGARMLGWKGLAHSRRQFIEIRNHRSRNPLPIDFSFDSHAQRVRSIHSGGGNQP